MSECYMLCSISVSGRSFGLPETGFLLGGFEEICLGEEGMRGVFVIFVRVSAQWLALPATEVYEINN